MPKKAQKEIQVYRVVCGCNTSDDTRYEIGDEYHPGNHPAEDTAALIGMGCLEESE